MSVFKWWSRNLLQVGEVRYSVTKYSDKIRRRPALIRQGGGSAKPIASPPRPQP